MAITTYAGLAAGLRTPINFSKASATSEGGGNWHSLWKLAGVPLTTGSNPPNYNAGSGYACSRSTAGALPLVNPASGNLYIAGMSLTSSTVCSVILYDRLWACANFVTNTTSTQTITTPGALPARDILGGTDGDGVELWGEVYTAPGATAATWTVNYKDQDNNSAQAVYSHPANAESVGQMFPFILESGDWGVRSVEDFDCSISSGTAGVVGLTLLRRIVEIPVLLAGGLCVYDAISLGFPRVYDDSCLAWMVRCSTTASGNLFGSLTFAEG